MEELVGTKTLKNLMIGFVGEGQSACRYRYYSKIAKKEGFLEVSEVFEQASKHEFSHAKNMLKHLNSSGQPVVEITASFPTVISSTVANLEVAIHEKKQKWSEIYPDFMRQANNDGFDKIAMLFKSIASAEKFHQEQFMMLLRDIRDNQVFVNKGIIRWKCLKCGFSYEGVSALVKCPACDHPQTYFVKLRELV